MQITVRKGGKIVRVTENELAKYTSKGYVIVADKKATEEQTTVPQEPIIEAEVTEPEEVVTTKRKRNK